ncbi:MAG TPA: chemotaxis response regulator protein-glutamate methylesterase [Terriglobales bacterium]|nr:chemotaxis response regulator protein-glutamate methylesterase [Terriglobales bacterium]
MDLGAKTRVLLVDDSTFMRKVLQSIIAADPQMEVVGEARDGREAIAMAESLRPDVVSMDIMMPHVDGLQATQAIMSRNPRPIVIVSSETKEGADITLKALELGAIDFIPKPTNGVDLDMQGLRDELCRKLKVASRVRVIRTIVRSGAKPPAASSYSEGKFTPSDAAVSGNLAGSGNARFPLVIVAASTGGPQALMQFIPALPANFAASVLLVQHMPGTFTAQFAKQLGEVAAVQVKEAENNDALRAGTVYVCPGAQHMRVMANGRLSVEMGERIHGYRPCADVTMETAACFAGPMTVGVVLTGMGADGSKGVQAVKAAGGHVIAQDEVTSVIFGMPAEAIKTGMVDQVLAIEAIVPAIEKRILYVMGAARVGAV